MTRRLDFDSFRRERSGDPVVVAVAGVEYLLPAQLPAATALDIIALNSTAVTCDKHQDGFQTECPDCVNPDATPEQIFHLAEPLFGKGVLRTIAADADLTVDELGDLIINVFQLYNSDTPAPNRAARRSRAKTTTKRPRARAAATSG